MVMIIVFLLTCIIDSGLNDDAEIPYVPYGTFFQFSGKYAIPFKLITINKSKFLMKSEFWVFTNLNTA